jgi:hypothetical protein
MSLFKNILHTLSKKLDLENTKTDTVATIVQDCLKTPITSSQVKIQKGTLFLSVSPTIKMAVSLKKQALLACFKEKGIEIHTIV